MQLSTFIRDNIEPLLAEWEAFARTLLPATKDMTVEQLRNHARQLLEAIASDLDTPQSAYEQTEKSQGRVPQPPDGQDSAAQIHAGMRADSRLTLNQMVSDTGPCARACCGFGARPRTETWEPANLNR